MKKSLAIAVLIAIAAAILCQRYFSYLPIEEQVLARIGLEQLPLGITAGESIEMLGKPSYLRFDNSMREIAGKPVEVAGERIGRNPAKGIYDMLFWSEKGVLAFARRRPGELEGKFRDNQKFRVTNFIVPVRWEFVLVKPDGATQKIKTPTLIPIRVKGKPLFRFTPADFRKIYLFIREESPGVYTMGKYPLGSNVAAYFSEEQLQYVQITREYGLLDGLK